MELVPAAVRIDELAVLRALNLNPTDPNTGALLLICQRYGLDPILKHVVLISGRPYVTRDGYLSIAHQSGVFDGIEVTETGETDSHYTATVAVWRKDMTRPFRYVGRFPKAERMAQKFGPEMAIKTAEVQALRRAFDVTGIGAADERWDVDDGDIVEAVPVDMASAAQLSTIQSIRVNLTPVQRTHVGEWWKAQRFPPLDSGLLTEAEATAVLDYLTGYGMEGGGFADPDPDPEPELSDADFAEVVDPEPDPVPPPQTLVEVFAELEEQGATIDPPAMLVLRWASRNKARQTRAVVVAGRVAQSHQLVAPETWSELSVGHDDLLALVWDEIPEEDR